MARQLRIQYEGAIYHLMSRGDRREEIFRDDVDRKRVLGIACKSAALGNDRELKMDSATPRNGVVAARLQPSLPIEERGSVKGGD